MYVRNAVRIGTSWKLELGNASKENADQILLRSGNGKEQTSKLLLKRKRGKRSFLQGVEAVLTASKIVRKWRKSKINGVESVKIKKLMEIKLDRAVKIENSALNF